MNERPGDTRALAVLVALGGVWGASFLFIKVIVDEISPMELAAGRLALGAVGVAGYMAWRRLPLRAPRRLVLRLIPVAALANILPFVLIGWSEERIDSGVASVLNATLPIFTAVFGAAFLLEERFSAARGAGVALGFVGILVLAGNEVVDITDSAVLGQGAVVAAAACYGASSTYMRALLRENDAVSLAALQLTLGTVLSIPLVVAIEGSPAYGSLSAEGWASLLALGLVGTGIAYIAYVWLIETTGSVRASLVTYIIPVVGLILGWLVLDEGIGLNTIAGAALIVAGVAIVMRGQAPGRASAPPVASPVAAAE